MRLLQPGDSPHLACLPSIAHGKLARGRRQALGDAMGRPTIEDMLNGVSEHSSVQRPCSRMSRRSTRSLARVVLPPSYVRVYACNFSAT